MSRGAIRVAFLVVLFLVPSLSAQSYDLVLLDVGGAELVSVAAINDSGEIVGMVRPEGVESTTPVIWRGSERSILGGPAARGYARGINSRGEVALELHVGTDNHALVWYGSAGRRIEAPDRYPVAMGLNDAGAVTGFCASENPDRWGAFRWLDGRLTMLPRLRGIHESIGYAINASGDVAGSVGSADEISFAVIWKENEIIELPALPGASYSLAVDINDSGVAVGSSGLAYLPRAVRWENSQILDLGTAGEELSAAHGINEQGVVVGAAVLPGEAEAHAMLWRGRAAFDLNALIRDPQGCVVLSGAAINNRGQIAALGRCGDDDRVLPMRLDPRTEPRRRAVGR